MGDAISTLGDTTFDTYLNDRAYWRSVPANVWSYKLGGYQVLKKRLSYRERKVLGNHYGRRRSSTSQKQHGEYQVYWALLVPNESGPRDSTEVTSRMNLVNFLRS